MKVAPALVAFLLLALSREATGAPPPAPPPPAPPIEAPSDEQRAKELKQRADEEMSLLRFAEALELYDQSYALLPSPALHYNRGRALQLLDRLPEALDAFEAFRKEAPEELKARVPTLDKLVDEIAQKVSALSVRTKPVGATVSVGGRDIGTTPFAAPVRVRAAHAVTVTIRKEGYHTVERTVELPGGSAAVVNETLEPRNTTALLQVRSAIAGAVVHVDGQLISAVPAERYLPPGEHAVEVSHEDFETAEVKVALSAGERKTIDVELERQPEVYERWWFWTAIGGAVATGVVLGVVLTREEPADSGDIAPGQIAAPIVAF